MDSTSEARLAQICPTLADRIRLLATQLAEEGVTLRVTAGLRPWSEQQALYAQGRTIPGKIVTDAQAGHSWHQFGLAVDVAPFDAEGKPDWNAGDYCWKRIILLGERLGMVSGSTFKDCPDNPHFQMTGSFPVSPDDEVRLIFLHAGMIAVWVESGLYKPTIPNTEITQGEKS